MFDINTANDKLKMLEVDLFRLKQNPLDISLAEKACMDAWHISDWVFAERFPNAEKDEKRQLFHSSRNAVFSECPELKLLHDIANTLKHKALTRPKIKIRNTAVKRGGFSNGFSKRFDVSRLEVHYSEDSKIDVDDLIQVAIDYWEKQI